MQVKGTIPSYYHNPRCIHGGVDEWLYYTDVIDQGLDKAKIKIDTLLLLILLFIMYTKTQPTSLALLLYCTVPSLDISHVEFRRQWYVPT